MTVREIFVTDTDGVLKYNFDTGLYIKSITLLGYKLTASSIDEYVSLRIRELPGTVRSNNVYVDSSFAILPTTARSDLPANTYEHHASSCSGLARIFPAKSSSTTRSLTFELCAPDGSVQAMSKAHLWLRLDLLDE